MTAQSQISNKAAAGAAAAAAAGVRLAGGMLSVDAADGGLRIYYDKLTLLLDSALPLGGNCTVSEFLGGSCRSALPCNCRVYAIKVGSPWQSTEVVVSVIARAKPASADVIFMPTALPAASE